MIFSILQEAFLGQVTQSHSEYHRQLRFRIMIYYKKMIIFFIRVIEMIFLLLFL